MKILIAGGGTGGHLFPGVAIAEEFRRRNGTNSVLFIGTKRGLEARVLPQFGFDLETLEVEGIKGRGMARSLAALLKIPRSLIQSRRIIRGFGPDIVIGVGGYASGPAVLAARLMGTPTAIAEQNAIPGETNKILGRFADRIFVSFPETSRWFRPDRVRVTGNPIRAAIAGAHQRVRKPGEPFGLLIFGGSQGAHRINLAMAEALPRLAALRGRLQFLHATGAQDAAQMREAYREGGWRARVEPFFEDMAAAYAAADFVVARSGASTVFELAALGKPALLVPYPFAANDHQRLNAEAMVGLGAAWILLDAYCDGPRLAATVQAAAEKPEALRAMGEKARALARPEAAERIVELLERAAAPPRG